jgi:hypothetical protein
MKKFSNKFTDLNQIDATSSMTAEIFPQQVPFTLAITRKNESNLQVHLNCHYNPDKSWDCVAEITCIYQTADKLEPRTWSFREKFSSESRIKKASVVEFDFLQFPRDVKDELFFELCLEILESTEAQINRIPPKVLWKIFEYSGVSPKELSLVSKLWKDTIDQHFIFKKARYFEAISMTSEIRQLIHDSKRRFGAINVIIHDENPLVLDTLKEFVQRNLDCLVSVALEIQGWRSYQFSWVYEVLKILETIRELTITESPYSKISRPRRKSMSIPRSPSNHRASLPNPIPTKPIPIYFPNLSTLTLQIRKLHLLDIFTLRSLEQLTLRKAPKKSHDPENCPELFYLHWTKENLHMENFCSHTPISDCLIRILEPRVGGVKRLILKRSLFVEGFCEVIFQRAGKLETLETDLNFSEEFCKDFRLMKVKRLVIRNDKIDKNLVLKIREIFPSLEGLEIQSGQVTLAFQNFIRRTFRGLEPLFTEDIKETSV